jgi:uncharacterized BrkB/YihY/UPF0761 family membrane protein
MKRKIIKNKLLIAPGYIIGLGCLILITYRTLIAFFSESKAVIIHINNYNEQFIDLLALGIIWSICLFGLFILYKFLRDEKAHKKLDFDINKQ